MRKKLIAIMAVMCLSLGLCAFSSCGNATGAGSGTESGTTEEPTIETKVTDYTKVATGTKYYVSTSGSDENDGKSPEKPIKTLQKASEITLEQGDGLFFKRGDTWKGEQLVIRSSGTKENPIYVSAYGEGEKPHFTLAGKDKVCFSTINSAGMVISSFRFSESYGGLEVSFNETEQGEAMGREYLVVEDITAENMTGLYNSDEYQYNHTSFGFLIRSRNTSDKTVMLSDLAVRNCYFYNCNVGMGFVSHIGYKFDHGSDVGEIDTFLVENVTAELCGQWGMHFSHGSNGVIRYVTTKYTGQNANSFGSCAFLTTRMTNVLVEKLLIDGHYRNSAQSYDGCGYDFEAGCVNVTLKDSVIRNIDGCGIFIFDNGAGNDNVDILIDNVEIENFGQNVNETYACAVLLASNSTGKISNCTFKGNRKFDDVPVFRTSKGSFENFVLENNKEIQGKTEYEYDFSVNGNVQQFGTTYYYWEDITATAGSSVDGIKVKNGYLTAWYGNNEQYIQSPDYIACKLSDVNTLYLKIKNDSSAKKMRFEYSYTSKPGTYGFEFDLPEKGKEAELTLDLNELIKDKRGYLKDFRLYIDGEGEISIAHIGIRV